MQVSVFFDLGRDHRSIVYDSRNPKRRPIDLLKKLGFTVVFEESPGVHTWIKLAQLAEHLFALQLFQ